MIYALYRVEYRKHMGKPVKLIDLTTKQIQEIDDASYHDGFSLHKSKEGAESVFQDMNIYTMRKIVRGERYVRPPELIEVDKKTYDEIMNPWKKLQAENNQIEAQISLVKAEAAKKIDELNKQAHNMCGYCSYTGHSYCDGCTKNAYNLFSPEKEE